MSDPVKTSRKNVNPKARRDCQLALVAADAARPVGAQVATFMRDWAPAGGAKPLMVSAGSNTGKTSLDSSFLFVDPKAGEPAILYVRAATNRRRWTMVSLADVAKPASPGDALRQAKEAAKVRKAAIAAAKQKRR